MPGLDPSIHEGAAGAAENVVDGRDTRGHRQQWL
jgi:hypothetical protein